MKLSVGEIRRRKSALHTKYLTCNRMYGSIQNLVKNCNRTKETYALETLIDNWESIPLDKPQSMRLVTEQVNSFSNRDGVNESKQTKVCNALSNLLRRYSNPKYARRLIERMNISDKNKESLLETCNRLIICDRIINNQAKLEKHNVSDIVENYGGYLSTDTDLLNSCIYELCEVINNINMNFSIKFNVALENVLYTLEDRLVKFDKGVVLENVTSYFLHNCEDSDITEMKRLIEKSLLYTDEDKEHISFLYETASDQEIMDNSRDLLTEGKLFDKLKKIKEPTKAIVMKVLNKMYTRSAQNVLDDLPNFLSWFRTAIVLTSFSIGPIIGCIGLCTDKFIQMNLQRKETERYLKEFKVEKEKVEKKYYRLSEGKAKENCKLYLDTLDKQIDKIQDYRDSLYSEKELDAQNENTELSDFEMKFLQTEGRKNISVKQYLEQEHPIVVQQVKDLIRRLKHFVESKYGYFLKSNYIVPADDNDISRFSNLNYNSIEEYIGEDNKVFFSIAECLPLNAPGERLSTTEGVCGVLDEITDYLEDFCNDRICILYEGDEELYHIYITYLIPIRTQDVEFENVIHIDDAKRMGEIIALESSVSHIKGEDIDEMIQIIDDDIPNYDNLLLKDISDVGVKFSDIIDNDELYNIYLREKRRSYNQESVDYVRTSIIQNCLDAFEKSTGKREYNGLLQETCNMIALSEFMNSLKQFNRDKYITETSLKTNARIAAQNIKKKAQIAYDKQDMLSKRIDSMAMKFNDSVQKELTNRNREAVIRGRIIPSASAIIKLAIASAGAAIINPALGVITALGGLAASKRGTDKERKYILDEIDIQLKVVDKKIQLAESNNDMKAMEQLLKIQQQLKRERQRIFYRMRNYYPAAGGNRD